MSICLFVHLFVCEEMKDPIEINLFVHLLVCEEMKDPIEINSKCCQWWGESLLPSGHLHKNSTDVWELGQEISSTENGGKCLEASRFCCVDCMFLIVLPSILQMSSMLQMCASWGRRSTVMGTVSHALEGCTERAVTCLSSLPPWLDHAHSGGHVSAGLQCWSVNRFFELKKTNLKKIHSLRVGTIIQAGIIYYKHY